MYEVRVRPLFERIRVIVLGYVAWGDLQDWNRRGRRTCVELAAHVPAEHIGQSDIEEDQTAPSRPRVRLVGPTRPALSVDPPAGGPPPRRGDATEPVGGGRALGRREPVLLVFADRPSVVGAPSTRRRAAWQARESSPPAGLR